MKRLAIVLLLASCSAPSVSPEGARLVPLIKAERFDELTDPDHLGEAFVEALREMQAEGADPKRIVAVADFFFDNYPFCAKDLAIDEAVFEAVAEAHHEASIRFIPDLDSCRALTAARTFIEKTRLLETWKGRHQDGGRCAVNVRRLLDRALQAGKDWDLDSTLSGVPVGAPRSVSLDDNLEDACHPLFMDQPQRVTIVFAVDRLGQLWGHSRADAWNNHHELDDEDRWTRLFRARRAWLAASRHPPYFDLIDDIADSLKNLRFDPVLRELGSALGAWGEVVKALGSGNPLDPDKVQETAAAVIRHGKGTPFPDAARYSQIAAHAQSNRPEEAERCARELRLQFDRAFLACHGLLESADLGIHEFEGIRSPEKALRLAREVLEWDPTGPTAGLAWMIQARVHGAEGREREKIACLEAALRSPDTTGTIDDDSPDYARSEAGRGLARHHTLRRDWPRALEAWKAWQSWTMCATCSWSQREEMTLGIAGCLEKMGRFSEAADSYWEAATGQGTKTIEAARKVKEMYAALKRMPELAARVNAAVHDLISVGSKVEGGLRWLANDLKVSIK